MRWVSYQSFPSFRLRRPLALQTPWRQQLLPHIFGVHLRRHAGSLEVLLHLVNIHALAQSKLDSALALAETGQVIRFVLRADDVLHTRELLQHYLVDVAGQVVKVQIDDFDFPGALFAVLGSRLAVKLNWAQSFLLGSVRHILRCLIRRHKTTYSFICFVIGWGSFVNGSFIYFYCLVWFVRVSVKRRFKKILPLFLLFVISVILSNLILHIVIQKVGLITDQLRWLNVISRREGVRRRRSKPIGFGAKANVWIEPLVLCACAPVEIIDVHFPRSQGRKVRVVRLLQHLGRLLLLPLLKGVNVTNICRSLWSTNRIPRGIADVPLSWTSHGVILPIGLLNSLTQLKVGVIGPLLPGASFVYNTEISRAFAGVYLVVGIGDSESRIR